MEIQRTPNDVRGQNDKATLCREKIVATHPTLQMHEPAGGGGDGVNFALGSRGPQSTPRSPAPRVRLPWRRRWHLGCGGSGAATARQRGRPEVCPVPRRGPPSPWSGSAFVGAGGGSMLRPLNRPVCRNLRISSVVPQVIGTLGIPPQGGGSGRPSSLKPSHRPPPSAEVQT